MIPIKFDAYDRPLGTPDAWMGYCIDLLNHIASDVGFNYTVHITPDRQYGSGIDVGNGTIFYNGIMGELIREVSVVKEKYDWFYFIIINRYKVTPKNILFDVFIVVLHNLPF